MVILPCVLQLVGEHIERLGTPLPDQEARRGSTHSTDRQKQFPHKLFPAFCRQEDRLPVCNTLWMQKSLPCDALYASRTLKSMDRVRLGRVLGRGARYAARTAYEALDAATAAAPAAAAPPSRPQPAQRQPVAAQASHAETAQSMPLGKNADSGPRETGASRADSFGSAPQRPRVGPNAVRRQPSKGAASSLFSPFRRATHAVSLEVTGSFFALFAFSFGMATWHARGLLHGDARALLRFAAYAAVGCFFAYASLSNFWKARRLAHGSGRRA